MCFRRGKNAQMFLEAELSVLSTETAYEQLQVPSSKTLHPEVLSSPSQGVFLPRPISRGSWAEKLIFEGMGVYVLSDA